MIPGLDPLQSGAIIGLFAGIGVATLLLTLWHADELWQPIRDLAERITERIAARGRRR